MQTQEPIPHKGTQMKSEVARATVHLTRTLLEQGLTDLFSQQKVRRGPLWK